MNKTGRIASFGSILTNLQAFIAPLLCNRALYNNKGRLNVPVKPALKIRSIGCFVPVSNLSSYPTEVPSAHMQLKVLRIS